MKSTGLSTEEMELLRQIFRRHPEVQEVRLFGSRAKGTHTPSSDIDLAVSGNLGALQAEALAAELDELPLPYRYDVVALPVLRHSALREHIERAGRSIYLAEVTAK